MKKSAIRYALLGDGRVARHMHHYLGLLGMQSSCWSRRADSPFNTAAHPEARQRLAEVVYRADSVLLLVSDGAIAELVRQYPELRDCRLVHFSGATSVPGVAGAHPLMTFANDLYSLDEYSRIPFMVEEGQEFEDLLPGLPNPHFQVAIRDKAMYHALCVIAGNFPQILWQSVRERFAGELHLPPDALEPYLDRALKNFMSSPDTALTGPLARNDMRTIERNFKSLDGDPLQDMYRAFVRLHASNQSRSPAMSKEQTS